MKKLGLLWETCALAATAALMATMGCASDNGDEWVEGEGAEAPASAEMPPEIGEAKQALGLLEFAPPSNELVFNWWLYDVPGTSGTLAVSGGGTTAGYPPMGVDHVGWQDWGFGYQGYVQFDAGAFAHASYPRTPGQPCPTFWLSHEYKWQYGEDEWAHSSFTNQQEVTASFGNGSICFYDFYLPDARIDKWMNGLYDCAQNSWQGPAFWDADTPSECPWGAIIGPDGIYQ